MSSTHEVYIDVRYYPRHNEHLEEHRSSACKAVVEEGQAPLNRVANELRAFADEIDPEFICTNCGATRGEHHREGRLYHCFNRYGPITQSAWWRPPRVATRVANG